MELPQWWPEGVKGDRVMATIATSRKRLASNHNETIVAERVERSRKRLASNHNETIVAEQ